MGRSARAWAQWAAMCHSTACTYPKKEAVVDELSHASVLNAELDEGRDNHQLVHRVETHEQNKREPHVVDVHSPAGAEEGGEEGGWAGGVIAQVVSIAPPPLLREREDSSE